MERAVSTVKRPYDSTRRKEHAQRNRDAVLDAAQRLFLSDGYAVTTIAAVAHDAGVSAETIYKSFGSKTALVRAIWERGLAGHGPVPAPMRSDQMSAAEGNPRVVIQNWGKLTTEVMPIVGPILLLVRATAATDADMATLLAETDRQRRDRMRRNAERLTSHLRPGVTLRQATDILWLYSSPDLYDLLVLRGGWSMRNYARHLVDSMVGSLLVP
jgi:AcrR family transcriptional regulator